jgi:hypothetical protein
MSALAPNYFETLQAVNVNGHIEKKGKFSYLSWAFAFAELFKRHPDADITAREWDGFPAVKAPGKGWMVHVTVTVNGVKRGQWHPVLDNSNRPIADPDVFQINTSLQRAAVKAIALHGLGLYIYAGEDLPEAPQDETSTIQKLAEANVKPDSGVWESLSQDEKQDAQMIAATAIEYFDAGDVQGAADYLAHATSHHGIEVKTAINSMLSSSQRSALKKHHNETRRAA